MTQATLSAIVSLVPSHSETLAVLGADLVGVTRFCTRLPGLDADTVARVGGTKNPDVERIVGLAPDVVVMNEEENRAEDAAALRAAGLELLVTHPRTLEEGIKTIRDLGEISHPAEAAQLAARLLDDLALLEARPDPPIPVFVPIWRHGPGRYMTVNATTYAHDVVTRAGAVNVAAGEGERFPDMTIGEAVAGGAAVALLGDEPYAFGERHTREFIDAGIQAVCCSGEDLHWYGPRSVEGLRRIRELFNRVEDRLGGR
ncbi:MAG: ABC transporter substrate-binding protein [Acidimicrobiia bacterium]|nr:ABC transporter substrate-binding protein [Acidimicrobiia bacterium]